MKVNWNVVASVVVAAVIVTIVAQYTITKKVGPDGTITTSFLGFGG